MWELNYTTRFKKDLKRFKRNNSKLAALKTVLEQLQETGSVDASHKPHHLVGEYAGCMECHIESDFLLIWIDEAARTISLVRLGSHSELFK